MNVIPIIDRIIAKLYDADILSNSYIKSTGDSIIIAKKICYGEVKQMRFSFEEYPDEMLDSITMKQVKSKVYFSSRNSDSVSNYIIGSQQIEIFSSDNLFEDLNSSSFDLLYERIISEIERVLK
jgi:hypothetical protein